MQVENRYSEACSQSPDGAQGIDEFAATVFGGWVYAVQGPHSMKAVVSRHLERRKRLFKYLKSVAKRIGWDGPISEVRMESVNYTWKKMDERCILCTVHPCFSTCIFVGGWNSTSAIC